MLPPPGERQGLARPAGMARPQDPQHLQAGSPGLRMGVRLSLGRPSHTLALGELRLPLPTSGQILSWGRGEERGKEEDKTLGFLSSLEVYGASML